MMIFGNKTLRKISRWKLFAMVGKRTNLTLNNIANEVEYVCVNKYETSYANSNWSILKTDIKRKKNLNFN